MINNVVLVGRMVKDADLRYTPQNQAVATFSLAVNRNFKSQNGEREADFISCVIWRKQAENLANWAKKGTLVGIEGRIQTRNYENAQGQRVYVTEVVAEKFQVLENKNTQMNRENGNNQAPAPSQGGYNSAEDQTPNFGNGFGSFGGTPMDVSDDDLPF